MQPFSWLQTSTSSWSCRSDRGTAGMGSALGLLLSLGSSGRILHPLHNSPQTNPHTGTAPRSHPSQPCDTARAQQGCPRARQSSQSDGVALPRHRLHFEATQGWELSCSRVCKQTIVFNCHWLFLSLFSHFLKSLT